VALVVAALGTAIWLWLLRWRTGRHRDALWKCLVLPAGGVSLCWLLLMTLGLPILDYGRSHRPLVQQIARHVPADACVASPGQGLPLIAALEYIGRFAVDASADDAKRCPYLLRLEPRDSPPAAPQGWSLVTRERRPTDRVNLVAVYRRVQP